jgi:hypothetical protein
MRGQCSGSALPLLVVLALSACSERLDASLPERSSPAVRTTRQEARSTNKVLILGSSVSGGINSREALAVAAYASTAQIDVVTPAEWEAMTPVHFMAYRALIIGDAACQSGTAAFQAAINTRGFWGPIVDGNVVILNANVSSNNALQIVENAIWDVLVNTPPYRTGMYISLGCAYQNAMADTPVTLLEPFGEFKVEGLLTCADSAHIFQMYPNEISWSMFDGLLVGDDECSTRSVFTSYPGRTFSFVALAQSAIGAPIPGEQTYTDYLFDPSTFLGTPYILMRGASPRAAGCGLIENPPDEECDLGDNANGVPAAPGQEPLLTCSWSCRNNWCGDGVADFIFGEECDNGIDNGRSADASGDIGECSSFCKITPLLPAPPVALCRDVTVVATDTCGVTASIDNGSYDPDFDLVECVQAPGGPYPIRQSRVTLTCTDSLNQQSSCTGIVTVTDQVMPTVTLLGTADPSVECSPGAPYTDPGAIADDLCEGPLPVASVEGSVNTGQPGVYTLTYTAMDTSGNSGTASRSVSVIDSLMPTLALFGPATLTLECGTPYTDPGAMASDACFGDLTSTIFVIGSINAYVPGDYTITYFTTDPSGNSAVPASRTVQMRDTLQPSIALNGPNPLLMECASPFLDPGITASDACQGDVSSSAFIKFIGVDTQHEGDYLVLYEALDAQDNRAQISRDVQVRDTTAPLVTVPPGELELSCGGSPLDGVVATDACHGDLTSSLQVIGPSLTQPGTYLVRYQVSDLAGNTTETAPRTVRVLDSSQPRIVLTGSAEVTLECQVDTYVDSGAQAWDQCDSTALIVQTYNSGQDTYGPGPDLSAPGTYFVEYLASNANWQLVRSLRTVHVVDQTPPALTLKGPAHLMHPCGSPWTDPGVEARDACSGDLSLGVVRTGSVNDQAEGVYTLRYDVTDGAGLSPPPVVRTVEVIGCSG